MINIYLGKSETLKSVILEYIESEGHEKVVFKNCLILGMCISIVGWCVIWCNSW